MKTTLNEYAHLSGLELADCSEGIDAGTIDVLIGSDFYWKFVAGKVQRGEFGPVAIYSKLGWLLSGLISSSGNTYTHLILSISSMATVPEVPDPVQDILHKFWDTKSIGIVDTEPEMMMELLENIYNFVTIITKHHYHGRKENLTFLITFLSVLIV